VFDDTPIEEIAEMLEHNHGLEVTVVASAKERTFTANVPSDNIEMLLNLLNETLGLKITRRGNVVRIE
jgi:ferric-dicitrate binding protein FerR (iron transport regulator)